LVPPIAEAHGRFQSSRLSGTFYWEVSAMATRTVQPELSDAEWDLVRELLEAKRAELPGEIHHTHTFAFRDELRRRLNLIDCVLEKLRPRRD
jgi:hypothetical protein